MKKRVVSLLMICALSVGMLAGCGSSETQNQATGSADNTQTAGTETVAETKTPEVADDANLTATAPRSAAVRSVSTTRNCRPKCSRCWASRPKRLRCASAS